MRGSFKHHSWCSQVQQLLQLLQTPYAPPPSCLPTQPADTTDSVSQLHKTVVGHAEAEEEKSDRDMAGEGESQGTETDVKKEAADMVTTAVAAGSEDGVSRYYSKPPDWALTLCVTWSS